MRRSIAVLAAFGSASCTSSQRTTVTLVTHNFFTPSKSVLRAFTRQTGITVKVLKQGDAGSALNQVILTKRHPLGDAQHRQHDFGDSFRAQPDGECGGAHPNPARVVRPDKTGSQAA